MDTQVLHTDNKPSPGFDSHFFAQFAEVGGSNIWNAPCKVVRRQSSLGGRQLEGRGKFV